MDKKLKIAIDGPAAAGKSTVAKIVAEKLSYIYIDTGAMYRALTLKTMKSNISLENEEEIERLLKNTIIKLEQGTTGQKVILDQKDVTSEIRSERVTNHVSIVSKHQKVREEMVRRQQLLAEDNGVVMDGRDIGTHVLPDAEVKVFLIASAEERAQRRHKENLERGIESNLLKLQEEIEQRDAYDSNRKFAPLVKAKDAIEIDTTPLTINEVAEKILDVINKI